jgi:hypothetical protein
VLQASCFILLQLESLMYLHLHLLLLTNQLPWVLQMTG